MKSRLVILAVILAFVLAPLGCCTRMVNGKETKTFFNCLSTAQDYICNPPADVQGVATAAIPLLVTALNMLVPGTAAYINISNAATVASNLEAGLCVYVTELNNLIAVLQSKDIQAAQAKMLTTKALPAAINIQALINWAAVNVQHPK